MVSSTWITCSLILSLFSFAKVSSVSNTCIDPPSSRNYSSTSSNMNKLKVLSWNIAAINNNPFEYWITHSDPRYNNLMNSVQSFIQNPGEKDVPLGTIFTDTMYEKLENKMKQLNWNSLIDVKKVWDNEFKNRKIISEFLTDGVLGNKRLMSMPDRLTNTINLPNDITIYRPTPINCYEETFSSFNNWWDQWLEFMFENRVNFGKKQGVVAEIIEPIKKSKYPAITESEEKISVQLSTLNLALFDAVLVHMLNNIDPTWQEIRHEMCLKLNRQKNSRILEILKSNYNEYNVLFLQEVANSFKETVEKDEQLNCRYQFISPVTSGKRDQNSVILLDKDLFDIGSVVDLTQNVIKQVESNTKNNQQVPLAEGDLVVIKVSFNNEQQVILASFHGDTDGLATIPVVQAVYDLYNDQKIIFGLDANTYFKHSPGKSQSLPEFISYFVSLSVPLNSCYNDKNVDNSKINNITTHNGRTFLQPQLNKGINKDEILKKGDVNQKDFILFFDKHFQVVNFQKDNTGKEIIKNKKTFIEDMVFPTLEFPSDHAIISCDLIFKNNKL